MPNASKITSKIARTGRFAALQERGGYSGIIGPKKPSAMPTQLSALKKPVKTVQK